LIKFNTYLSTPFQKILPGTFSHIQAIQKKEFLMKNIWMRFFLLLTLFTLTACGGSNSSDAGVAGVNKQQINRSTAVATKQTLSATSSVNGAYYVVTQQSAPAVIAAYNLQTHAPLGTVDISAISGYNAVSHMIASPDGTRLYVMLAGPNTSTSNTLLTIDTATQKVIRATPYISASFSALGNTELSISPDGSKLLLIDFYDSRLHVLDAATGNEINTISVPSYSQKPALGLAMSQSDSDSVYLMASNSNSSGMFVHKISLSSGSVVRSFDLAFGNISPFYRTNNRNHLTISPDGKTAYFIKYDNLATTVPNVNALDLSSGALKTVTPLVSDAVNDWQITRDGKMFFTEDNGTTGNIVTFVLYDPATDTRTTLETIQASCGGQAMTFSPYYDSTLASAFFSRADNTFMQATLEADGSVQEVDLGASVLGLGPVYSPLWSPFAIAHN
jgi:YVTN family beta-propeller protein